MSSVSNADQTIRPSSARVRGDATLSLCEATDRAARTALLMMGRIVLIGVETETLPVERYSQLALRAAPTAKRVGAQRNLGLLSRQHAPRRMHCRPPLQLNRRGPFADREATSIIRLRIPRFRHRRNHLVDLHEIRRTINRFRDPPILLEVWFENARNCMDPYSRRQRAFAYSSIETMP